MMRHVIPIDVPQELALPVNYRIVMELDIPLKLQYFRWQYLEDGKVVDSGDKIDSVWWAAHYAQLDELEKSWEYNPSAPLEDWGVLN